MSFNRPFPQDLIGRIIDFLHDDIPSLLICSVISKEWLPEARYHIFYLMKVPAISEHGGWDHFINFLCSAPGVGKYIKEVHLIGVITVNAFPMVEKAVLQQPDLLCLLELLNNLQTLELQFLEWAQPSPEEDWGDEDLPAPVPLKTLTLHQVISDDDHHGFTPPGLLHGKSGILRLFSSLQYLGISETEFRVIPDKAPDVPFCQGIRHLAIHNSSPLPNLSHLIRDSAHNLESLAITTDISTAVNFAELIRGHSTILRHFEILLTKVVGDMMAATTVLDGLEFAKLTSLRSLIVTLDRDLVPPNFLSHNENSSSWPFLVAIAQRRLSSMQTLTIRLLSWIAPFERGYDDTEAVSLLNEIPITLDTLFNWPQIVVSMNAWDSLRDIVFSITGPQIIYERIVSVLEKRLIGLKSSITLQFKHSSLKDVGVTTFWGEGLRAAPLST